MRNGGSLEARASTKEMTVLTPPQLVLAFDATRRTSCFGRPRRKSPR
ncbi:MAG: hypothetical protein QOJ65_465 [Fimbriimonadaceae bacterium]|nr:hypothetical protein [Fimbriimonadaceae bacterium]